ncbi:MAG TPA: type II toxin-antitoxin system VapC family toxin [Stellaceae bacterium]|nr:type II toxin-antitoxin system VapC family toxin [Stellaceae bacterium]
MSGFVIDASVALAWCFDDEATAATRALLDRFAQEEAEVPSLWHLELANALALSERNRRITAARASEFIELIDGLPIVVDSETPARALGAVLALARREGLSAYDAAIWNWRCAAAFRWRPRTALWHRPRSVPA